MPPVLHGQAEDSRQRRPRCRFEKRYGKRKAASDDKAGADK